MGEYRIFAGGAGAVALAAMADGHRAWQWGACDAWSAACAGRGEGRARGAERHFGVSCAFCTEHARHSQHSLSSLLLAVRAAGACANFKHKRPPRSKLGSCSMARPLLIRFPNTPWVTQIPGHQRAHMVAPWPHPHVPHVHVWPPEQRAADTASIPRVHRACAFQPSITCLTGP